MRPACEFATNECIVEGHIRRFDKGVVRTVVAGAIFRAVPATRFFDDFLIDDL